MQIEIDDKAIRHIQKCLIERGCEGEEVPETAEDFAEILERLIMEEFGNY